jgi:hypothetical protein
MNASYALTRFLTATESLGPAARLQAFRARPAILAERIIDRVTQ